MAVNRVFSPFCILEVYFSPSGVPKTHGWKQALGMLRGKSAAGRLRTAEVSDLIGVTLDSDPILMLSVTLEELLADPKN